MTSKSRDLWAATLGGLVTGGLLTTVLDASDVPLSTVIGALVGGLVAAYVLYGKVSRAAASGALAGILGIPFFLGVVQILLIFGVIPLPSGPNPSMADLQGELAFIFLTSIAAGAVGGAVMAAVHHPPTESGMAPPSGVQVAVPTQTRYCVQCGAQLPAGAVMCPHCNARQPQ